MFNYKKIDCALGYGLCEIGNRLMIRNIGDYI